MSTLYELSDQFQSLCNILESLEDEQIPVELQREVESLLAQKDETQAQLYSKIDNYISLIKHLEMFAEMREKEAKRMAELAKRDRNKVDFLKKQLLNHFESTGQSKVKTWKYSVGLRKASQAPLHLKGSVEELPDEFKKVIVEPDKKALRDAIKSSVEGIDQYAELGDRSSYLSIR